MSIGMHIHDKTRRYSSAQSRKTKACRAGAHTAGTRIAGMGGASAQNASMHSAQDHLGACGGVDEKGDVGDGDERSPGPQDVNERGGP